MSLKDKLADAKKHLDLLYESFPHLDPKREEVAARLLEESFQKILKPQSDPAETLLPSDAAP